MTVYVEKSENSTLESGVTNLMNAMIEDYKSMGSPDWDKSTDMEKRYAEGFTAKKGKKYIKIISNGSAKCFVVAVENDKKFKQGDVLFASSWDAPARNRARGNVIDGGYGINWTGAEYL